MSPAEKKISGFCARRQLAYEWQPLKCDGRRAVIESLDRTQHAVILTAARRLKGIRTKDWTCDAGGVWEGRIYLQDEADAKRIDAILKAEYERNQNWCQVYHDCIEAGMDTATASARAEALYPTPAVL